MFFVFYKDTHFELVAEKTDGGHTGNKVVCILAICGATSVEFVANKVVTKEGSDCCGEWGVVCITKGNGGNGAGGVGWGGGEEGADVMMTGVWDPHTWLRFSC